MAQATLSHLLAHSLATNDQVPAALQPTLRTLSAHRTLSQLEHEEGLNGPLMHRWQLRLTSLIASSQPPAVRSAGFQLLHHSYSASTALLLATGKAALAAAQSVLASPKTDPDLFCAALELVRILLAKSTYHPEWARENVGAQTVQKLVNGLVQAASAELSEVVLPCVSAIVSLIPLYPTALRPLSPALHALSISLIAAPSATGTGTLDAGAHLFVSLYLLAPKGRDGLREAWKTGVEALVGSIDGLVGVVTASIFSEDILYNHSLTPLALPPLSDSSPLAALARLESLLRVLLLCLRTPTAEKAGCVSVPLASLAELATRLAGLSTSTPVRERTDPSLRQGVDALLPRLQVVGAQLAAQVALAAGAHLAPYSTAILSALSGTLATYPARAPMRPALSAAYALVLEALGAAVDPEEGKRSLARVWRVVLEDIGSVALEPVVVGGAGKEKEGGGSRKAKRQKTYDPSESMAARRVGVDEVDLDIAERGLATLDRLLRTPHAQFLPPKLQLATSRLLLFLALSPSFFQTHPVASTSSASFFPPTSASSALDIARQSPAFRRGVVRALLSSIECGLGGSGLEEKAAPVWRRALLDQDSTVSALAHRALVGLGRTIHPTLPPQQGNKSLARQQHEQRGGFVGDEVDFKETAEEFRVRVQAREESDEEEEDEGVNGNGMAVDGDELRRRKTPPVSAAAPAPAFASAPPPSFAATPSFPPPPASATSGFSAFAAPSFSSQPSAVAVPPLAPALPYTPPQPPAPVSVSAAPEVGVQVEVVRKTTVAKVVPVQAAAGEGDSDDDEDEMPVIHMGSDEE
ncbi:hypothetical protein JCM10207_004617 [Rhodosporidiobolus poonsookiae]